MRKGEWNLSTASGALCEMSVNPASGRLDTPWKKLGDDCTPRI